MKQFNWLYYFVLILFIPVIFKMMNYMTVFWAMALLMGYLSWMMSSGIIIYIYKRKAGVRDDFCIDYIYNTLTMLFWVDTVHKELAVLCMLNPFRIQYFSLDRVEKIEPVVSYAGKKKNSAYGVYFNITINGKKTSVGVASSGKGPLLSMRFVNSYLEDIQEFKHVIWEAKSIKK
ncbi:MAG: hypothetical protein K2P44_15050 [Lachnospiraceae bacterium]|nr:hypothetical protein [Lachnospiraceae bacterium]